MTSNAIAIGRVFMFPCSLQAVLVVLSLLFTEVGTPTQEPVFICFPETAFSLCDTRNRRASVHSPAVACTSHRHRLTYLQLSNLAAVLAAHRKR